MAAPDASGPVFQQQVTAVAGFAYGAINADIHVFANGEPLYLLTNWATEPEADADWLREMPSRLLNAHRGIVPFTGRDAELADLRDWRESGPRLSVRWLHAPGGQGKSRLAAQLAAESLAAGWKVVVAFHGPDADPPEPGSQDLSLTGAAGLLLVVDYADRWLLSNLTWLLKNALLHQVGVRTRILMIGRSLDAWPAISGILDNHRATTSAQRLPEVPGDGRPALFEAAWKRFAAIYRLAEDTPMSLPANLAIPEFGPALAITMAALAAVDAAAHGRRPPATTGALTRYLLNREQLHWRRLHHDGVTGTGSAYGTPPDVLNRVVFTAGLSGALDRPAGVAVLKRIEIGPDIEQVLTDHAVCYPSTAPDRRAVLEPLYPDRLTEDFLALTMPGHDTDYPAQDWAPADARALLTARGHPGSVARSLTFLAAADDRWPHLGRSFLHPFLRQHPALAVDAGGPVLTAVAASRHVTIELLEEFESRLPADRHVDLDIAAATVTAKLTTHRLARTTDPAERARLYAVLAYRLANAGRDADALAPAQDSTAIYRRLVDTAPDTYRPALARSLKDESGVLSALGRHDQALARAEEAAAIYRQLAGADPDTYLLDLAGALNDLGTCLSTLGLLDRALSPTEEAVTVARQLVRADPDNHLASLATTLHNLGILRAEQGQLERALLATEESTTVYRELARADAAAHLPELAGALVELGLRLWHLRRLDPSVLAATEAVTIYRQLAETNADAYQARLGGALHNLAISLDELGRREQALHASEEAVAIYRRLADANPDAHLAYLAAALTSVGTSRSHLGHRAALPPAEQAVAIYRQLADAYPDAYLPGLAAALDNLGIVLSEAGQVAESLPPTEEATTIRRRLAQVVPDTHRPELAGSLHNLSIALAGVGEAERAVAAAEEAVAINRRLAELRPDAHLPDLAMALTAVANRLAESGRFREALPAAEEAVGIHRRLAEVTPEASLPGLAYAAGYLSVVLTELRRYKQALHAVEEAVAIYRRLAGSQPDAYLRRLAGMLTNLGLSRANARSRRPARPPIEEAITIFRRLAEMDPGTYRPDLAQSLLTYAEFCAAANTGLDAAHDSAAEAVVLYEALSRQQPHAFLDQLRTARATHSGITMRLRHR